MTAARSRLRSAEQSCLLLAVVSVGVAATTVGVVDRAEWRIVQLEKNI